MITYRAVKGSDLTPAEVDQNFTELDTNKLNKSEYAGNNTVLVKDNGGAFVSITINASQILGRKATGEIVALTAAELKGIIFPASTGWGVPTGTADKTTFATSTVTLEELAERVKALTDALLAAAIISA